MRNGEFDNEFHLMYQPYFDRSGKTIVGVEALLRWDSPKMGKVNPGEFIPISEKPVCLVRLIAGSYFKRLKIL